MDTITGARILFILLVFVTHRNSYCSIVGNTSGKTGFRDVNKEMKPELHKTSVPDDINRYLNGQPICGTILVYYGAEHIYDSTTQLGNGEELFSVISNATRNVWLENEYALEGKIVGENCGYNVCGLNQSATILPCQQRRLISEVGFDPKLKRTTVTCKCGDPECLSSTCAAVQLNSDECARLYIESLCHECYSESVKMPRIFNRLGPPPFFSEYSSMGNIIKSAIVNEGCEIWIEDSTVVHGRPLSILKPGLTNPLPQLLNEKKNVLFKCFNLQSPQLVDQDPPTTSFSTEAIIITVSIIVFLILLAIGVFLAWRKYASVNKQMQERTLPAVDLDEFFNGKAPGGYVKVGLETKNCSKTLSKTENDEAMEMALFQAYQWKWEIPKKAIIKSSKLLGRGQFGQVYEGSVELEVLVKAAIKEAHGEYVKPLLMEIKILSYIGQHPNIVNMLGASVSQLRKGKSYAWLVLELCAYGSLKSFLHLNRPKPIPRVNSNNASTGDSLLVPSAGDPLCRKNLCRWSLEIALGMEYLEKMKILHIDLAARNVLLDENLVAKLGDFGSSRKLCSEVDYWKHINPDDSSTNEPLAFKWMALESLQLLIFTSKSDVWSYGVTIWEIFEYGKEPYPQANQYDRLSGSLQYGMRLPKPTAADDEIYAVMKKCWESNPDSRPTFAVLTDFFKQLLKLED